MLSRSLKILSRNSAAQVNNAVFKAIALTV